MRMESGRAERQEALFSRQWATPLWDSVAPLGPVPKLALASLEQPSQRSCALNSARLRHWVNWTKSPR